MATYSFSNESVNSALETVQRRQPEAQLAATPTISVTEGHLLVAAECIKVEIEDNKVCLVLPLGLGEHCLPIPISIPNGTAAEACLSICTKFGIPTGVKIYIKVAGNTIIEQTFGIC